MGMSGLLGGARKPVNRMINRDPANEMNFADVGSGKRTGLVSSAHGTNMAANVQRGQKTRATMTYEKMMRFGSGAAAGRLQKNAFSKLVK